MTAVTARNGFMARAHLAGLLARGFAYPDEAFRLSLLSGAFARGVSEACRQLGFGDRMLGLEAAIADVGSRDAYRLAGEHTHMFARNVLCPMNEASYLGASGLASVRDIADVASLYNVFGYKVSPQARELADSLPVELEFLGALLAKEAYALEQGWEDRAQVCGDVRSKFVNEHFAWWLPQFAERVRKNARMGFYPALAGLAEGLLSLEHVHPAGAGPLPAALPVGPGLSGGADSDAGCPSDTAQLVPPSFGPPVAARTPPQGEQK